MRPFARLASATRSLALMALVFTTLAAACPAPASAARTAVVAYLPIIAVNRPDVLLGAGDIADCATGWDEQTAGLVNAISGTVVTMGDNVYENGTPDEFKNCYDPSWGLFKDRTRPAPGNHDYNTAAAAGYYGYFGPAAHQPTGYYSYELGAWHIIALNSNCDAIGGCQAGAPQEVWLRADLAAHPAACTLAYWHHPRFSSGPHGDDDRFVPFWQDLYDAQAEIVLNGHDHDYERFAPQTPYGQLDRAQGVREFVVGTGGRHFSAFGPARRPNSEASRDVIFGVLKLTLYANSYRWDYLPIPGIQYTDAGNQECH